MVKNKAIQKADVSETYRFLADLVIACLLVGIGLVAIGFAVNNNQILRDIYLILATGFIFITLFGLKRIINYYFPEGTRAFWNQQGYNNKRKTIK